jgi:hypothetical protein
MQPYLDRMKRFLDLRRLGVPDLEISRIMGLSRRTIHRYALEAEVKGMTEPHFSLPDLEQLTRADTPAETQTMLAYHVAAHAVDLKDALELAGMLDIPRAAFAAAAIQLEQERYASDR